MCIHDSRVVPRLGELPPKHLLQPSIEGSVKVLQPLPLRRRHRLPRRRLRRGGVNGARRVPQLLRRPRGQPEPRKQFINRVGGRPRAAAPLFEKDDAEAARGEHVHPMPQHDDVEAEPDDGSAVVPERVKLKFSVTLSGLSV